MKFSFCLVLFLTLSGQVSAEITTILAVKDRDPNPSTSHRLAVTRVELDGFRAYPEFGISAEAINDLLAKNLAAATASSKPNGTGFTPQELEQLGRFLSGMNILQRQTPLTAEESAALLEFVSAQKRRRGISVVQLEQLAGQVTQFYHQHGLPLGTVFLPAQEVAGEVVKLRVLEGRLGAVVVNGAEHYGADLIQQPFTSLIGRTVQKYEIESALYLLNDLPGLDTRGTFTAGERVGETRLDVAILRDDRFNGTLQLDNHGDDATGNRRFSLHQNWLNASGLGDQIGVGWSQSFSPGDASSSYAKYQIPLGSLKNRLHFRISRGAFDWQNRLQGDTRVAVLGWKRVLERSRRRSLAVDVTVQGQALDLIDRQNRHLENQNLLSAAAKVALNRVFDNTRLEWDGGFRLEAGSIRKGRIAGQNSHFWRAGVDTTAWRLIALPGFAKPQKLSVILHGQMGSGALPAALQIPLGGPYRVRAFDVSTYSADRGIYAGLELRFAPPWSSGSWLLFTDAAYGEQQKFGGLADSWAYLASVGIGWDFTGRKRIQSSVRAALPMATKSSGYDLTNDGFTVYWNIRYRY